VPKPINYMVFEEFTKRRLGTRGNSGIVCMVYDGAKTAFSPYPMPFGKKLEIEVMLDEPGTRSQVRKFLLKMKEVKTFRAGVEDMRAKNLPGSAAVTALNVMLLYSLQSKYFTFNDAFFSSAGAKPLSGGLEVWSGFFCSFIPIADGVALNVDTSACVFYRPDNLLDLLVSFIGLRSRNDLYDPRLWQNIKRIQAFLKNKRVTFNYRDGTSRDYKVIGLSATGADTSRFTLIEEGAVNRQVTVKEYFAGKFGIQLKFPTLPCIEVKRGNLIPIELCQLVPGQRYINKLDEIQNAEMLKFTCLSPHDRAERIFHSLTLMGCNSNECFEQFGVRVTPTLKRVDTRILPPPMVLYHPSSKDRALRPVDGAWNLRGKKVFEGMDLQTWAVVVFAMESRLSRRSVESFVGEFVSTCTTTGMSFTNPYPRIYYAPACATQTARVLYDIYITTGNDANMRPQLLMCILPDKGSELYGAIKTACELELGIPTQCIQSDKVCRPNKQYCANVCLKVNAKLGGTNATMPEQDLADLKDPPTILLGADISSSPGLAEMRSVAALIGSMDFAACRYASEVSFQKTNDFIVDLQEMVMSLLRTYYKTTAAKPAQIIYFRDGVSNGQFRKVLDYEMRAIKQACRSLEEGYNPRVTFVIIQKRHHTRFLPTAKSAMDRSGNCKAGTLVETGICHPYSFDFFLQSHSGLQGTSRPIHYYVLVDEIRFTADRLQKLCYNLCYLFNRATRAVSIVPPIYYAHLAANRASCHFKTTELSGSSSATSQSAFEKASSVSLRQKLSKVMYYI
ncbi:hypothetical protein L0F63_001755, partial [Massospora cicadina]